MDIILSEVQIAFENAFKQAFPKLFFTLEQAENNASTLEDTQTQTQTQTQTASNTKSKKKKNAPKLSSFTWPFVPDLRRPKANLPCHIISPSCLKALPQLIALGYSFPVSKADRKNGISEAVLVAQKVVSCITLNEDVIIKATVVSPGFIQLSYGSNLLRKIVLSVLDHGINPPKSMILDAASPLDQTRSKKLVIVDFSSPNIAKEMHVGHLRSTIIGESLCRILEFCGYNVDRVNHIGDWGTQFGMLIAHLKDLSKEMSQDGEVDLMKNPPKIADLQTFYTDAKKRFDSDVDFKQRSRLEVVSLQSGNTDSIIAWKLICEISAVEYRDIYSRLGVSIHDVGESFYNDIIPQVNDLLSKIPHPLRPGHMLAEKSQGALCVFTTPEIVEEPQQEETATTSTTSTTASSTETTETTETTTATKPKKKKKKKNKNTPKIVPPLMIQKTDGGFSYDSTDMAAIWYRFVKLNADRVVYVVGGEQSDHFQTVFDAAKLAGWVTEKNKVDHAGFGMVCGSNGKKFSTREGGVVKLKSLLDEAVVRYRSHLIEKEAERKEKFDQGIDLNYVPQSPEQIEIVSSAMGHSAVKYFDLRHSREKNYVFDYDKMLDTRGDTAVYINYAFARMCQIKKKRVTDLPEQRFGGEYITNLTQTAKIMIEHDSERDLVAHISTLPSILEEVVSQLIPHRLCEFSYELCSKVASFYRDCKVIGDEKESSRLLLLDAAIRALYQCLSLLGITPLQRI